MRASQATANGYRDFIDSTSGGGRGEENQRESLLPDPRGKGHSTGPSSPHVGARDGGVSKPRPPDSIRISGRWCRLGGSRRAIRLATWTRGLSSRGGRYGVRLELALTSVPPMDGSSEETGPNSRTLFSGNSVRGGESVGVKDPA